MAAAEADNIKVFYEEAGVAQYADALVAAGYDLVRNVLALDAEGMLELKAAVNMLPGHVTFLRTHIGQRQVTAAPAPAAGPLPAAAAAPAATQEAAATRPPKEKVEYIPASGDEAAMMHLKFETKYSKAQYGNTLDTYKNAKDESLLCTFIGYTQRLYTDYTQRLYTAIHAFLMYSFP